MVQGEQLFNRSHRDHLPVGQHRHTVADRVERVEVVGDQENGEVELVADRGSARRSCARNRIEPGGRLVEEQKLRVERQRPGEPGALDSSRPTARTGYFGGRVRGQPDMAIL